MNRILFVTLMAISLSQIGFTYGIPLSRGEVGSNIDLKKVSTKPIEITAEKLVAEREKNRVVFKGNVLARQESLSIYSDLLTAWYGEGGEDITRIEAEGNVRVVQEGIREAKGNKAIFLNDKQTVELLGNTIVSEGESRLMGDRLIIYLKENKSVIQGGKEGRVKAIINPEKFIEKKDKAGK